MIVYKNSHLKGGCHTGAVYNGRRLQFSPSQGGVAMEYLVLFALILIFATGYILSIKK